MQDKTDLSYKLGRLFASLAHPARTRIVQELGNGEMCVNTLAEILKISHSSVSQHLAILRAQRIIKEQKSGRFVFYRLIDPEMAIWIGTAANFVGAQSDEKATEAGTPADSAPHVVRQMETQSFSPRDC